MSSSRQKSATESYRSLPDGLLPRTRTCLVCGRDNPRGFHLRSRLEGNLVKLEYTTRDEDTGYVGVVHGGIVATLLDEVMTWAAIVSSGRICVAVSLHLRLHRPIPPNTEIQVCAQLPQPRRLMEVHGTVHVAGRDLVAECQGRYLRVKTPADIRQIADFLSEPDTVPLEAVLRTPE